MSDWGIKITKSGYDVSTATILEQTFNSQKNSLKIALEGSTTSTANGDRTVQITHGLSVVPSYLCFFQVNNSGKWYSSFETEIDTASGTFIEPYTDSTYLNIKITSQLPAGTTTVKIYYFIIVDPAQ